MIGKLPPDTLKPVPEIESELMVTAAVPFEVSVTDFVTAVLTATLPNASDVVLRLKEAVEAFSVIAKLFEDAFADAAILAVCAVLTADIFAVNDAVEAPDATVTLAGTLTAVVLLESVTLWPVEDEALRETVQVVDPVPVKVLFAQVKEFSAGAIVEPDPLSLMEVVFETDPWLAVRVTVCAALTAATVATKGALVAPDGTVTEGGTSTALLLLASVTAKPEEGAAAVRFTVQLSVPAPIIEEFVQLRADRDAVPEFDPFP